MAISKLGGSTSDNWELVSSVTPTAASAAVNFTGLSLYRKLMIVSNNVTNSGAVLSLRINNDSTLKYLYRIFSGNEQVEQSGFRSSIDFTNGSAFASGMIIIESCDTTGIKTVTSGFGGQESTGNTASFFVDNGIYLASAVVTQINVVTSGTYSGGGTLALYGVK